MTKSLVYQIYLCFKNTALLYFRNELKHKKCLVNYLKSFFKNIMKSIKNKKKLIFVTAVLIKVHHFSGTFNFGINSRNVTEFMKCMFEVTALQFS